MINYSVKVGKGRDVGLNQIGLFEGKVSGGIEEKILRRDAYRLGNFLISSECYRLISQLLVTMHAQWLVQFRFFSVPIYCNPMQLILLMSGAFSSQSSFCLL